MDAVARPFGRSHRGCILDNRQRRAAGTASTPLGAARDRRSAPNDRRKGIEVTEAFLRTTYTARLPDGRNLALRIGERNAALDELLAGHGARTWAYITAWNPGARRLEPAENAARHGRLISLLARCGKTFFEGEGVPDDPGWEPERSVLVLGVSLEEARDLGIRLGQLAIVFGRAGEAPQLIACTG